jgi:hypothetical protein
LIEDSDGAVDGGGDGTVDADADDGWTVMSVMSMMTACRDDGGGRGGAEIDSCR